MLDITALEMKFLALLDKLPLVIADSHPYVVHFAIALPFTALILLILSPSKAYSSSSTLLFILSTAAIILAFITGHSSSLYIEDHLAYELHKTAGSWLTLGIVSLMFLKLLTVTLKQDIIRYIIIISIFIALISLGYVTKTGHDLIYQQVPIENR